MADQAPQQQELTEQEKKAIARINEHLKKHSINVSCKLCNTGSLSLADIGQIPSATRNEDGKLKATGMFHFQVLICNVCGNTVFISDKLIQSA